MDINNEIKLLIGSCLQLSADYRYLAAKAVYLKLLNLLNWNNQEDIEKTHNMHSPPLSHEVEQLLSKNAPLFEKILKRVDAVETALSDTSMSITTTSSEHNDRKWEFGSCHLGVTTHYMVYMFNIIKLPYHFV